MTEEQLSRALEFCKLAEERQKIYIKKKAGEPKPWTEDKIFQSSRFCNVFREQDKTSVFIKTNIIDKYRDDPNNWKRIIIARFFSRLDTLQDLEEHGEMESVETMLKGIERRRQLSLPVHTHSFFVGRASPDHPTYLRPFNLVKKLEMSGDSKVFKGSSLEKAYLTLREYSWNGSFMSYQYVCDLAYDEQYLLNATDHDTFIAFGPGSQRGMNRILTGEPYWDTDVDFVSFCVELLSLWRQYVTDTVKEDAHEDMKRFYNLHLCNVQHWLCEYDKYKRGGSSKRRYEGI